MHYIWQSFLFPFLLIALFGVSNLAAGGRIHLSRDLVGREAAEGASAEYVSPNLANLVRRQDTEATAVAVPKNQLDSVLLQLMDMELAILILKNAYSQDGTLSSEDASGVFAGYNVVSISSPQPTSVGLIAPGSVPSLTLDLNPLATQTIVAVQTGVSTGLSSVASLTVDPNPSATETLVAVQTGVSTGLSSVASLTLDPNTLATGTPVAVQTGGSIPCNGTNVATSSLNITAVASSTTLPDVVAESTAEDSAVVPLTSLTNVVAESTATVDSESGTAATTVSPGIALTPFLSSAGTASTVARAVNSGTSSYKFSAVSTKNVAVYFGQTAVTGGTTLAAQCADPNIDIVILAFVISATYEGSYPQINFGAACGGQTALMTSEAPGLLSCTKLATDIGTCQTTYGKKVFLSVGGAVSTISFPTAASATNLATTLWNLFGPPGNINVALRPFGTAQIDGFDIDNENGVSTNWNTFGSALRSHFASAAKTKTYYLSSAPQCPFPDASNPSALLLICDFVWVQFYNNPSCQIGATSFAASVKQWSTALSQSTTVKTMFYVGAPAFSAAGPSAYAAIGNAQGIQSVLASVKNLKLSNFGGAMFWDGPEGSLNTASGKDIFAWAKSGLT